MEKGTLRKNILLVDKNVGKFKNMGEGKLEKWEGDPKKADSYSRGNTVHKIINLSIKFCLY